MTTEMEILSWGVTTYMADPLSFYVRKDGHTAAIAAQWAEGLLRLYEHRYLKARIRYISVSVPRTGWGGPHGIQSHHGGRYSHRGPDS